MADWTAIASAVLVEVGLAFDDVYDLGREWRIGPPGFEFMIGRPTYRGVCHPPSHRNPHSRRRALIGITGPVDSETMLCILAHECGHALQRADSTPEYLQEYRAETYAHDAIRRHLGREPHDHIVAMGKKYVRRFCWTRFFQLGAEPTKRWSREAVEWCGFDPGVALDF